MIKTTPFNIKITGGWHRRETNGNLILPSKLSRSSYSTPAQERNSIGSITKETNYHTSLTLPTGLDEAYKAPLLVPTTRILPDKQHRGRFYQLPAIHQQRK